MIRVGVVGGTGYTGSELLRILAQHPEVDVVAITSRADAGTPVTERYPQLRGHFDLDFEPVDDGRLGECDLVFFATPNGTAMAHAPTLLSRGVRVIDLAADFRLADATRWAEWYGMEHACPDLLSEAVYGLPELNRSAIRQARLVANPGCYPTAVTLGLLPLLSAKAIKPGRIIADAKSGVSGAGRKASAAMLMAEVGESFKAYSATGHRHHPEIVQTLSEASGGPIGLTFVPHLVPMVRGIEATLYADVADGFGDDLQALMEAHYDEEPFVDVMAAGSHPETRSVRGTNTCRLSVLTPYSGDIVVVQSVIDNLVKGAAGQAVHNMNLMFGLDEVLGLGQVALSP